MNTTHTHILKDPAGDKETERKGSRWRWGGEEGGESHGRAIKQSSESMVTGVRWEQGRRKSEYRCYQTHTSHTPACLFIFSFCDCKPPFSANALPSLTYLPLSQCFSLLRRVDGKVEKGTQVPLYKQRECPVGNCKGREEEWETLVYWHSHINHLTSSLALSLRVREKWETRREEGRWQQREVKSVFLCVYSG